MASQQKFQILANELNRGLSNITELKNSGYDRKQAREIFCSGIGGWLNTIRIRKRLDIPVYRLAEDTIEQRMKKNIFEKENWYKQNDENNDEEDKNPAKFRKTNKKEAVATSRRLRPGKKKITRTKDEKQD